MQLIGIFAFCINEFHLLEEILPCHKAEAFSTLQIQACSFSAKTWHDFQYYTYIPFGSSGIGGFPEYKRVYSEALHKNGVIHEKTMTKIVLNYGLTSPWR